MNRAAVTAWLEDEFRAVTNELKLPTTDTPAGYGAVLDATWRFFGTVETVPELALAGSFTVDDVLAVATWLALKRFQRKAAAQTLVGLGGGLGLTKARQQVFDHITTMLKQAEMELRQRGLFLDLQGQFEATVLDFGGWVFAGTGRTEWE